MPTIPEEISMIILLYILVCLLAWLSILLLRRIVGNALRGDFDDDY